jgi:hypothetical protein
MVFRSAPVMRLVERLTIQIQPLPTVLILLIFIRLSF